MLITKHNIIRTQLTGEEFIYVSLNLIITQLHNLFIVMHKINRNTNQYSHLICTKITNPFHFFFVALLVAVRWPRFGNGFGLPIATMTVIGMAFFGALAFIGISGFSVNRLRDAAWATNALDWLRLNLFNSHVAAMTLHRVDVVGLRELNGVAALQASKNSHDCLSKNRGRSPCFIQTPT